MRWIDYIVQAMNNLGGEATYNELYAEIKKLRGSNLTRNWQATVRHTVESYSRDSENWSPVRENLFYSVGGKGSGHWGLTNYGSHEINEPIVVDYTVPDKDEYTITRYIRDSQLAQQVKKKNNFMCQVCGFTFLLPNGKPYAEAHHLKPLGRQHNGPDIEGNMICVCPNHHAMLDYCALSLNVTTILENSEHQIIEEFINYSNQLVKQYTS